MNSPLKSIPNIMSDEKDARFIMHSSNKDSTGTRCVMNWRQNFKMNFLFIHDEDNNATSLD